MKHLDMHMQILHSLCKNINLLVPMFFHHIALETINDTEDNKKNEK